MSLSLKKTEIVDSAPTVQKWRRYPAYKTTGVEWLGEIPAHWEVKRLKYVTTINPDTLSEETPPEYLLRYVDIGNVDSTGQILDVEEITFDAAPSRARRRVQKGDTILSTVRTYLKAIAFMEDPPQNLIVSTGFAALRPNPEILPKFLWRLVQSSYFIEAVVAHSEGVSYPAINPSRLGCLPVWFPPFSEQQAITIFLDHETAKIDVLIAKKKRLIELLQGKRISFINHAVTRGLDPTVPLKDSGIEWLGQIPDHWKIMALKRIAKVRYGLGQPPPQVSDGVPLIRATNINSGHISDEGMIYIDPNEVPDSRKAVLSAGEIIVVRSGAYTGDSALIPLEYAGAIAGYDMVVTVTDSYSPFFAWQLLCPMVREVQFGFHRLRAAQPHLNAEELKETLVVVPPLCEQRTIATFLDYETAKIDALITKIREHIEKLHEYRTALISSTVTGKIDVRRGNNDGYF